MNLHASGSRLTAVLSHGKRTWPRSNAFKNSRLLLSPRLFSQAVVDLRNSSHEELERLCTDPLDVSAADITVIGTGGNELGPSFILNCPSKKYLFNHGEGWRRMIDNFKIYLPEQRMSLFTRASWENVSASCSIYFSQKKDRQLQQKYCGPRNVKYFMNFIQRFTGWSTWEDVQISRPGQPGLFEDENVKVLVVDLDLSKDVLKNSVVAYSCKLADWGGRFKAEEASRLGGRALKVLLSGRSVVLENGDLASPGQFVTGAKRAPTFLVVDCPTEPVANAVIRNRYLQAEWYRERGETVTLVVHITPLQILQDDGYCQWMASFGKDTKHLFLHSSLCPGEVSYRSAMAFSLPLHLMNPSVYQLPRVPEKNFIDKAELKICKSLKKGSITFGQALMKYHLKSSVKVDMSCCHPPMEDQVLKDLSCIREDKKVYNSILQHRNALYNVQEKLCDGSIISSLTNTEGLSTLTDPTDIQVTFLGTSSSHPTKIRGVSSILLQTLNSGSILLDCGEGTLCQLYRLFGRKSAEEVLRNLRVIFVSHMHLDHHFGLIGLIKRIQSLTENDNNFNAVKILAHKQYSKVLERYSKWCENIQFETIDAEVASQLPFPCGGDFTLQTVPVSHIKNSFGIVVRGAGKWSVVYSGDTMPCEELTRAGRDASLLIHEATQGDDMYQQARLQKHSTYREAVLVGKVMNARFTILTHFGRRFVKYPLTMFEWPQYTAPAVDFMSFKLSELYRQKLDSPSCRRVLKQIGLSVTVQNALEK